MVAGKVLGIIVGLSLVSACGGSDSGAEGGESGTGTGIDSLSDGVPGESSQGADATGLSSGGTHGDGSASADSGGTSGADTSGDSDGMDGSTGGTGDEGDSTGTGGEVEQCGVLPTVYRDFEESHPDFGCSYEGSDIYPGLVLEEIGADDKPQYNESPPSPPDDWNGSSTQITSAETFEHWYNTTPDINVESTGSIPLTETSPGSGVYTFSSNDFTPLGDGNGAFTTEIHTVFQYKEGQTFSFTGDDDLWIFIDGTLAVDVGGMHPASTGSVDLDTLGLVADQTYTMDIFHAERCYGASNFQIETTIACFVPQ